MSAAKCLEPAVSPVSGILEFSCAHQIIISCTQDNNLQNHHSGLQGLRKVVQKLLSIHNPNPSFYVIQHMQVSDVYVLNPRVCRRMDRGSVPSAHHADRLRVSDERQGQKGHGVPADAGQRPHHCEQPHPAVPPRRRLLSDGRSTPAALPPRHPSKLSCAPYTCPLYSHRVCLLCS